MSTAAGIISIVTILISVLGSYLISFKQTIRNMNLERINLLRTEMSKFSASIVVVMADLKPESKGAEIDFISLSYSVIYLLDPTIEGYIILRSVIREIIDAVTSIYTDNPVPNDVMKTLSERMGQQFDRVMIEERKKLSQSIFLRT